MPTQVRPLDRFETIKVEKEDGVTFVIFNRPEQRNAMSPQLHREMSEVLDELAVDDETKVLVLTGAGEAFCAGQDLKLYFRAHDDNPAARYQARQDSHSWRWEKLSHHSNSTIRPKPRLWARSPTPHGMMPILGCGKRRRVGLWK